MGSDQIVSYGFRNPVSAGTHLMWCLLGLYIAGLLWRLTRGDRLTQLSTGVFSLSMVLLYGFSGVYHAIPQQSPRLIWYFRKLDHSAIYVLIAGTYTPVCAVLLTGRMRAGLLSAVWGLAVVGIAAKWLLPAPPYWLTAALYIALGWTGLIPVGQLLATVGLGGLLWGLVGGLFYTFGGVCDAAEWPVLLPGVIGYHEVMHVADMFGTLTHVFFIVRYVVPFRR